MARKPLSSRHIHFETSEVGFDSPRKEPDLALRAKGKQIEISVPDTGAGLSPQIADRLFLPFSTTKKDGMGIGLSVCPNIVEAHHGCIWAEPNPARGTVFRFTLPLVAPDGTDAAARGDLRTPRQSED